MITDEKMADARDAWLAQRAEKQAEEARLLALRLAANERTVSMQDWEFAHAPAVEADEPEGEYIDDDAADAAWESAQGTYKVLTKQEKELSDAGMSQVEIRLIVAGACPCCFMYHGPRACPELRALLMDDAIDVDALIDSRDALLDRLAELEAA